MNIETLVTVPVPVGELMDKITILEVKADKLDNPEQLEAANRELKELNAVAWKKIEQPTPEFVKLFAQLKGINAFLWDLEDEIRNALSGAGSSHARAIGLIGAIHRKNDERARVKKRMNQITNSTLVEVKRYATQEEV